MRATLPAADRFNEPERPEAAAALTFEFKLHLHNDVLFSDAQQQYDNNTAITVQNVTGLLSPQVNQRLQMARRAVTSSVDTFRSKRGP